MINENNTHPAVSPATFAPGMPVTVDGMFLVEFVAYTPEGLSVRTFGGLPLIIMGDRVTGTGCRTCRARAAYAAPACDLHSPDIWAGSR